MYLRRIRYRARLCSFNRGLSVLYLFLFMYWVACHLPDPPPTQNDTRADRPSPTHRVDARPHFLYRSPYRQDPDRDYERRLSEALQELEQAVLAQVGGDDRAENRVWQIARDEDHRGPDSISFEQRNSGWTYRLVTDVEALAFVTDVLSAIPDIASAYTSYPHNVLRADLLRYLLLWYYGGFYADIDVFPAKPIEDCPALQPAFFAAPDGDSRLNRRPDVALVVGIEVDEPYATRQFMRDWHWTRSYGFIQYTMYAPRRFSPLLRETVVRVLSHTRQHEGRSSSLFRGWRYNEQAVLGVTGPDVFTDTILDTLSSSLPSTHPLVRESVRADAGIGDLTSHQTGGTQKRVTWAPFHRLQHTLCIGEGEAKPAARMGGVCVLPISVWGNGQRHSQAEGFKSPRACINHRFQRTWKKGWWEYIFG